MSETSIWTKNLILEFLKLYEKHPVIWNANDCNNKNRSCVADGWNAIKNEFSSDFSVNALKKKKESLMATYRYLKRKVESSKKLSGSTGMDDVYKPTWFAYSAMDRFLGKSVKTNDSLSIEVTEENISDIDEEHEMKFSFEEIIEENPQSIYEKNEPTQPKSIERVFRPPTRLKRKTFSPVNDVQIHKCMKRACTALEAIAKRPPTGKEEVISDEYSLYGQLLATKLRALSIRSRKILINQIDNLVFKAEIAELDRQPSNNFVSVSSINLDDSLSSPSNNSLT